MKTVNVLGVDVTTFTMDDAIATVLDDARVERWSTVEFLAVNNLVAANRCARFKSALSTYDYIFADGMPIAWLAKLLSPRAVERITARDFMWASCAEAERRDVPVFLYGTTKETLARLERALRSAFPRLQIAGIEPSVFRPLSEEEKLRFVSQVNDSGARIMFVALGCPLQEHFVAEFKGSVRTVQLCVGSAFPAWAGDMKVAPRIVQAVGLEWLHRLWQEPQRLWKRYLMSNVVFLGMLMLSGSSRMANAVKRSKRASSS